MYYREIQGLKAERRRVDECPDNTSFVTRKCYIQIISIVWHVGREVSKVFTAVQWSSTSKWSYRFSYYGEAKIPVRFSLENTPPLITEDWGCLL